MVCCSDNFRLFYFASLFVFFPYLLKNARAEEESTLDEIRVEETQTPSERALYPSSVRVFHKDDFSERSLALPEWLERESGLHFAHLGDEASPTVASIRGSTSEQVAIYLNGILLNPGSGGGVDLSQLSLHQIDKITVYKGKVPLSAGGEPIGGAIFIETAKAAHGRQSEVSFRAGSFSTAEGFVSYSETRPRFSLTTSYNGFHSAGDFTFLDDNGTPANSADDVTVARKNNSSTTHDWQVHVDLPLSAATTLEGFQRVYREDRGIPGLGTFQSSTANLSDTQSSSALNLHIAHVFVSSLSYTQKNSFLFEKSQFSDPNAEIGIGNPQDNDDTTFHYTHQELLDETLPVVSMAEGIAHFLWSYEWEGFSPTDYLASPSTGPSDSRHRFTWGSELEESLWHDRAIVSGTFSYLQLRNGFNDQDPSTSNPSTLTNTDVEHLFTGGAQLEIALVRDWISIDGDFARAVRPPNFFELFGDRGTVIGNPALVPETSWNSSGGLKLHHDFRKLPLRSFFWSASYFDRHSDNLIQFEQTSSSVARASNIGKSRAQGLEISSQASLTSLIDLETAYTLQTVTDENTGKQVPGHPRTQIFGELRVHHRLGPGTLKCTGTWQYEDGRFLDPNNSREVVHSHDFDVETSYRFAKGYRLFAQAKNIGNKQLVDVVGYPLPGRAFYGGLAWEYGE